MDARIDQVRIGQLAAQIRQNEQEVYLDFNDPVHDAYFCEQMGGEAYFKETFPALYAQYAETKRKKLPVTVGEPEAFRDGCQIIYGYCSNPGKLYFKGVTALGHTAEDICERVSIYHAPTHNLIVSTGRCTPNTHFTSYDFTWKTDQPEFQTGTVIFDYFSMWYDPEQKRLRACLHSSEDVIDTNYSACVQKINLLNPTHKKTRENEPIVVCYNRTPTGGEHIDYDYSEAFDPKSLRQWLYCEVDGEVTLEEAFRSFKSVDITKFILKLYCDSGVADYSLEGRREKIWQSFQKTETGFSFHLDKDWKSTVPSARLPILENVNFLMRFPFETEGMRGNILIDSTLSPEKESADRIRISPLQLLWGCVAENTGILMADGSEKPISEIQIGDSIALYGGMNDIVKDIFVGFEEKLLRIETSHGITLDCTRDHPVLTSCGVKQAQQLRGNDRLVLSSGELTDMTGLYTVGGEKVYSLQIGDLGHEGMLITNGLVTGDFSTQNRLLKESEKRKNDSGQITDEIRRLQAFFAEGQI